MPEIKASDTWQSFLLQASCRYAALRWAAGGGGGSRELRSVFLSQEQDASTVGIPHCLYPTDFWLKFLSSLCGFPDIIHISLGKS